MIVRAVIGVMGSCACLAVASVVDARAAHADHAPIYVVPRRADTRIIINGQDATYAVVEGEWGLSRPGAVVPTIVPTGWAYGFAPGLRHRHYFPTTGHRPRVGRREIIPARRVRLPQAESYRRSWTSEPLPSYRPPPPVIMAPREF